MSEIEKKSYINPCTLRCIYTERWSPTETENPLHDWVLKVLETGGESAMPEDLPPLVCSEIDLRQTVKGLRGSIWLLFSKAKTPHKKSAERSLTASHITIEVVYGVNHTEINFNLGPDWRRSLLWVDAFDALRENCSSLDLMPRYQIFPAVDRNTPDDHERQTKEAA